LKRAKFSEENAISEENNRIDYLGCNSYINYEVIFLPYTSKFVAITNFICNNTNCQLYYFPYNLASISNYEIPSDELDSEKFFSYYTENSVLTTIPTTVPTTIPTTYYSNHYSNYNFNYYSQI
jgi:hypothetical protein